MRFSDGTTEGWKRVSPHYDACFWKIHVPEALWKTATINLKFSLIESGINIHLFGDDGVGDGV